MKCVGALAAILCCLLAVVAAFAGDSSVGGDGCTQWVGRIVSLEGRVEVKKNGHENWYDVVLEETFCPGDRIRVAPNSRAAFVLANDALLRADQNTSLVFGGIEHRETFLLDLLKGVAHFFSRRARSLKVTTPFVNGTVEGTEFLVHVARDRTRMVLFEGRLRLANGQGSLLLATGQAVTAVRGGPLQSYIPVHPRDAVQWALYYPPVLSFEGLEPQAAAAGAVEQAMGDARRALAQHRPDKALDILEPLDDPAVFTFRAALRLRVGRVDSALRDIARALEHHPGNGRALALQAVAAVVQNRKDEALQLAQRAVQAQPRTAATRIALSYALQSRFDLQGALEQLRQAVATEPENSVAWARSAELRLALGEIKAAVAEAGKAALLEPGLSASQTILGFAHLTNIDTQAARQTFLKAIRLDSAAPLPRLGLGMAMIREGELKAGRAQIEIAAGLDPDNAMIRSYLGKAYFDEKRGPRDARQLEMAKKLDPNDPTPWFYDAIRKQSLNRPVEALHDLQKSIELNDNRAVYRSRFHLDEDLAARSAGLGRVYNDLGFQQMGLVEGWKSLGREPGNFSAHRLLADLYSALPRHEHARSSELLQAQLLQPINLAPVQPHLAAADLAYINNAGLVSPSLNEYSQLFVRNGLTGQVHAVAGEKETSGEEVILNAVAGPLSVSAGQLFFETDGFRDNNDQTIRAHDLLAQARISPQTSAQFAYQWLDEKKGDLSLTFDRDNFTPTMRQNKSRRSVRLGLRHDLTPNQALLLSGIHMDWDEALTGIGPYTLDYDTGLNYYEGLYLYQGRRVDVAAGFGDGRQKSKEIFSMDFPPVSSTSESIVKNNYSFVYTYLTFPEAMTWTIGGSHSRFEDPNFEESQNNPKLGLAWHPLAGTVFRAAYFRNMNREYSTMPTLEPSNVAGFNQLFDDGPGSDVWCKGIGIDQKVTDRFFLGAEYIRREIEILIVEQSNVITEAKKAAWEEDLYRAYLYWTPNTWLAPALDVFRESFTRTTGPQIPTEIADMDTWRISPSLSIFADNGLSFKMSATYIEQKGRFYNYIDGFHRGSDSFWVLGAIARYRLPKRFGLISLEGRNLLNASFSFQDTDPANSFIPPDRQVLLCVSLFF